MQANQEGSTTRSDAIAADTSHALMVSLMRVLRVLKRAQMRSAEGVGVPFEPGLVWVLHIVAETQPARLSELATQMHLDLSTASRHVRTLETAGCLIRTPDPDDRRASLISMTDEGHDLLRRCFAERTDRLNSVLNDWPTTELREFERLLTKLADDVETKG